MPKKRAAALFLVTVSVCLAQEKGPAKLILKVDEQVTGPLGGQRSSSCLRLYSDGTALYASWWNEGIATIDETGKQSHPEHTVSVEHRLDRGDLWELSNFLESKPVNKLATKFPPPHPPVDYIEDISVQFAGKKGVTRQTSTREFYVADLEEKSRYPSALIVLMDRIDQIEREANEKGKPAPIPADCRLK